MNHPLAGYFCVPHDCPPKWLFMFTAYVDETGHELERGWTFLAGFLGNEDQWKNFVPEWRAGLGRQRKFLHMSSLRWNNDSTRRLLARLGPIPEECGLRPIMAGSRLEDYVDLVSDKPYEKQFKSYLVCLHVLVIQVLREIPDDETLEIVFEEQRQYEPWANLILAIAARVGPKTSEGLPKLAKWSFVPKGSTIMTDPSDYFASALAKIWGTEPRSKKAHWCYPILKSGNGIGYGKIMQRDEIRPIMTEIVNPLLDRLNVRS